MSGGRSMKHSTSGIKPNGTSDRLSPPTLRPGEDFFRRTASPSSEERFVPSAGCRPQGSRNPQGRARRAREAITSPKVRILPGTSGTPVPPGFSRRVRGDSARNERLRGTNRPCAAFHALPPPPPPRRAGLRSQPEEPGRKLGSSPWVEIPLRPGGFFQPSVVEGMQPG